MVVGLVGACVGLAWAGWSPESITGFMLAFSGVAGGLLTMLGTLVHKTDSIAANVNGKLDARIARIVRDQLYRYFGGPPHDGTV